MPKIIHPENRLYYSKEDKNISSVIEETKSLIRLFGDTNQQAVFKDLRLTAGNQSENYRHLENFLRLIIMIRGEEIKGVIKGKTNMGAEIIAHIAVSEIELD